MDGLAALVKEERKADPFGGVIYVFRAKRADRVKLLVWGGSRAPQMGNQTGRAPSDFFNEVLASKYVKRRPSLMRSTSRLSSLLLFA